MERCIVAPVDGTPFGEHALPLAATLAKRSGSVLRVAHVHVPLIAPSGVEAVAFGGPWNEAAKQQEREYLHALADRIAAAHGVRVEPVLMDGPVAVALEEHIRKCGSSLVVMSTHAHTRLRRLWHACVADHIARELPVPVLLVRPPREDEAPDLAGQPEIRHVLIPLDGTRHAEAMVDHAAALGRPLGARFTLLRVLGPDTAGWGRVERLDPQGRRRIAAQQYLSAVAERMRAGGAEVRTRVVEGEDPAAAIVQAARGEAGAGEAADLIALEPHPHRPAARILVSHTADRVVRDAPVPVLLFAPPTPPVWRRATAPPLPSAPA